MDQQYHTIEEALEELRAGKIILVTDDPDRENEGDMDHYSQLFSYFSFLD